MTILGKILVIVNLVFSLVTGFLIIQVFVTRTNWKTGYDTLRKKYDVEVANARTYAKEADDIRTAADDRVKKIQTDLAQTEKERDQIKQDLDAKKVEYSAAEKKFKESGANITEATSELGRRKQEIDNLKQVMADKDNKLVQIEQQNKVLLDEKVGAEIAAKSEHERSQGLLLELERLTKEIERRQAPGGTAVGANVKRPPAEDVEGVVLASDRSGLVTISIGSDQGLSKGNTLEVYRYQPKPEYVGSITIVDVHYKEAVARPNLPLRAGPIQKGDIVASRIVAKSR